MRKTNHELREVTQTVTITTLTCNNCGKEVCDHGQVLIGGSFNGGWYNLARTPKSTALAELQRERNWDFCSAKCLREFVEKYND